MQRILIIKMSSLGDLFHALPAVHLLKSGLGASIDWVVHDIYVDLARCFTDAERIVPFPRRSVLAGLPALRASLREHDYDLIVDLQGLMKSAVVAHIAKGKRVIGPSFHREGSHLLYDDIAGARNKERHAVDECLDVVRHLGLPDSPTEFPVRFPVNDGRPRWDVAMLPCSRRADKNWTVEGFVATGRALCEKGARIALVGGPADVETCARIADGIGDGVDNMAGQTSMVQLGSLIQSVKMLVTVDSGPMHMAAALGIPVVAIFGPTYPHRTGPYGPGHVVVQQGSDLSRLPAEPVLSAALELYARRGEGR